MRKLGSQIPTAGARRSPHTHTPAVGVGLTAKFVAFLLPVSPPVLLLTHGESGSLQGRGGENTEEKTGDFSLVPNALYELLLAKSHHGYNTVSFPLVSFYS